MKTDCYHPFAVLGSSGAHVSLLLDRKTFQELLAYSPLPSQASLTLNTLHDVRQLAIAVGRQNLPDGCDTIAMSIG